MDYIELKFFQFTWLLVIFVMLLSVTGIAFADSITGTTKNDKLTGTQGADHIQGLAGNDLIEGLGGDDSIEGGPGNDNLKGGPGNDKLQGGPGKDVFSCGPGNDLIEDFKSEDRKASDCEEGGPSPIPEDKTGIITVKKHVINDDGNSKSAANFMMNVIGNNPSERSFKGSESGTTIRLNTGSYLIEEQRHEGYDLSFSKDCSGKIKSGETKNCTVTNDDIAQTGNLLVKKRVINDDGNSKSAADFTIHVTGNSPSDTEFKGSRAGKTVILETGSYSVTEDHNNEYTFTFSPNCSGTMNAGQSKVCTVTNDDKAATGTLIVKKHLINDNEGSKQASDFTIHVTGNDPSAATFTGDESGTEVKLKAGVYSVSESGPVGYQSSMTNDCNGNLNPGNTITCTITNDDIAPPPDTSSPDITSPTATPDTVGPGGSKISVGAHITDNVGVELASIGVYEKGKTDATIDGAFYRLGLTQGDNKNGQYVGEYTFGDSIPDGEYDVRFFARDAAQNQATAGLVTVTLDRIP